MIAPGRSHWDVFVGLCTNVQGALVTDAYLAARAIEHGCELITADSDFARYAGLRWRHPLGRVTTRRVSVVSWRGRPRCLPPDVQ
jgi:PIN domain